jgi:hypothetical protein
VSLIRIRGPVAFGMGAGLTPRLLISGSDESMRGHLISCGHGAVVALRVLG